MKKYVILGAITLVFFLGYSVASTEGYFHPYPYIDTKLADNFTWHDYERITTDMTTENVKNILGGPLSEFQLADQATPTGDFIRTCWEYSEDGGKYAYWDFAWFSVDVCFDETGKVQSKNQTVHYN